MQTNSMHCMSDGAKTMLRSVVMRGSLSASLGRSLDLTTAVIVIVLLQATTFFTILMESFLRGLFDYAPIHLSSMAMQVVEPCA